jgi:ribosomal protein S24E
MKILEDKTNELLKRREIKVIIEAEKNPSTLEVTKNLAEHFKTKEENISLKVVRGKFGRKTFLAVARIYNNKEDKDATEVTTRKQRAAANKAAGEKKEEALKGEEKK